MDNRICKYTSVPGSSSSLHTIVQDGVALTRNSAPTGADDQQIVQNSLQGHRITPFPAIHNVPKSRFHLFRNHRFRWIHFRHGNLLFENFLEGTIGLRLL